MENQLFFIGLAMGAYACLARRWKKKDGGKPAPSSALRHALFFFLAGFSVAVILSKSMELRESYVSVAGFVIPVAALLRGLLAGAVLGAIGYARAGAGGGKGNKKRRDLLNEDADWADTVFSAAFMASLLMMFVAQAFKIPSASMEKTLLIGDYLFVNKFLYGARLPVTGRRVMPLRAPKRGDIVVFQFPDENPNAIHCSGSQYGTDFVKRLIGEPGDKIEVREGRVILNGKPLGDEKPYAVHDASYLEPVSPLASGLTPEQYQALWETHRLDGALGDQQRDFFGPVTVPPHSYFMMGDNRDHSCDSRYWGPVAEKDFKGNAWFRYWPPSRTGLVQ